MLNWNFDTQQLLGKWQYRDATFQKIFQAYFPWPFRSSLAMPYDSSFIYFEHILCGFIWISDDSTRKHHSSCCCDQLLADYFAQNKASGVTMESVMAYKSVLLLQQQAKDVLPSHSSSVIGDRDWFRTSAAAATPNPINARRGSEAAQLRLWNLRMSQVRRHPHLCSINLPYPSSPGLRFKWSSKTVFVTAISPEISD